MTDDRGRYLTDMQGLTHEVFGGDPEEIGLRVAQVGEGARTLGDLARELQEEARRYERLHAAGWRLVEPFHDGAARCRQLTDTGEASSAAADTELTEPPTDLAGALEGADDLLAAAARLRAAARAYEGFVAEGRQLAEPVVDGRVQLE